MNTTTLALAGERFLAWAGRRLEEPSTYVGLALVATNLGFPGLSEHITGLGAVAPALLTAIGAGLAAASTKPRPPELVLMPEAPALPASTILSLPPTPTTNQENDMSIGSELKNVLGIVLGILIPGASKDATNLTTTIQNEIAKVYGAAATDMAKQLALDTTGMSGPDKVFAITKALVATAQKDGFKGDLKILGDVCVDIAQAAYRAAEPNFGAAIVALASAFTANPLVTVAAELVGQVVQKVADGTAGTTQIAAQPAAAAA